MNTQFMNFRKQLNRSLLLVLLCVSTFKIIVIILLSNDSIDPSTFLLITDIIWYPFCCIWIIYKSYWIVMDWKLKKLKDKKVIKDEKETIRNNTRDITFVPVIENEHCTGGMCVSMDSNTGKVTPICTKYGKYPECHRMPCRIR